MKRICSLACFTLVLAACGNAPDVAQTPDDTAHEIVATEPLLMKIEYGAIDDVTLVGYLAEKRDGMRHPAVVLVHDESGADRDIRDLAMRFAREGYTALAIDLYEGRPAADDAAARRLASDVERNPDRAFENLAEAVDYLRRMPSVNGDRIASVGWSFGDDLDEKMEQNTLELDASIVYDEATQETPLAADLTNGDGTIIRIPPPQTTDTGSIDATSVIELLRSVTE